jgi:hypothetical protein
MNTELKKIVGKMKQAQHKIQRVMKSQDWLDEARKYAERQGSEVKKLFSSDSVKLEAFLERQRKELARIQKRIPGEVKKYRSRLQTQSKELEKLLGNLIAGSKKKPAKKMAKSKTSSTATKMKTTTAKKKKKPTLSS